MKSKEYLKLLSLAVSSASLIACGSSSSGGGNSGGGEEPTAKIGNGIHLKEGSEGSFYNILLAGDYTDCLYMEDNTVLTRADDTTSNPQDKIVNVYGNCVNEVGGDSGYDVELAGFDATYAALNDYLAATGAPAVTATITKNADSNPAFTFDNTTYVGAVDPAATTAWYEFGMEGSYPAAAADIDLTPGSFDAGFTPAVTFTPDMTGITPATTCPAAPTGARVRELGTGYDLIDDIADNGNSFITCELSGDVMADFTLTNNVVWTLSGAVVIGNGNQVLSSTGVTSADVADVTLTIEAGTVMMSNYGSSLVVTRGSSINAVGTADQPIVMAGNNTAGYEGTGEWGGLVLQGYAYNNKCGDVSEVYCNESGEGDTGRFGGFDDADSSGTLQYVIITEAGAIVNGDGDELNGIGFMGVGYGTTVDHIQVHGNVDDGVEFFGGAVDVKYLLLTSNMDDSIDWDEGYIGNIQYALIIQTQNQASTSNRAFELDTKGDAKDSAERESDPTVANVTALASFTAEAAGL